MLRLVISNLVESDSDILLIQDTPHSWLMHKTVPKIIKGDVYGLLTVQVSATYISQRQARDIIVLGAPTYAIATSRCAVRMRLARDIRRVASVEANAMGI